MTDLDNYNVYQNKDGRYRAYNKITHKVTSYPRVLMESILGIQLLPTEDVHHKDEDYTNNNPDNLIHASDSIESATEEIKRFFNMNITDIKQASKQLKKEKL